MNPRSQDPRAGAPRGSPTQKDGQGEPKGGTAPGVRMSKSREGTAAPLRYCFAVESAGVELCVEFPLPQGLPRLPALGDQPAASLHAPCSSLGIVFGGFSFFFFFPRSFPARPGAEFPAVVAHGCGRRAGRSPRDLGVARSLALSSSRDPLLVPVCCFSRCPLLPAARPGEGLAAAPAFSSPRAPPCSGRLRHAWQITAALWEPEENPG